jgi:hypothetical protein
MQALFFVHCSLLLFFFFFSFFLFLLFHTKALYITVSNVHSNWVFLNNLHIKYKTKITSLLTNGILTKEYPNYVHIQSTLIIFLSYVFVLLRVCSVGVVERCYVVVLISNFDRSELLDFEEFNAYSYIFFFRVLWFVSTDDPWFLTPFES